MILTYQYVSKPPVRKPRNADSSSAAGHTGPRSFTGFSSKQENKDDIDLFDEKIHEKIFEKPNKAVVQRALDTSKLNPKKHGNIIGARNLWNGVFNDLLQILPPDRQAAFRTAVNAHERRFVDPLMMPEDGDYAAMAGLFADIAAAYLNTPHSAASITEEALGAGGSVHEKKNTGGHTNTQKRMAIPTFGGGAAFFDTGETREHGKQVSKKKQHREEREKNETKDALRIEQLNFVNQAAQVYRRLLENGMNAAAAILRRFIEDFG